jgi:hypothetical protein
MREGRGWGWGRSAKEAGPYIKITGHFLAKTDMKVTKHRVVYWHCHCGNYAASGSVFWCVHFLKTML